MLTRDLFAVADLVQSGDVMLISVNYKSITHIRTQVHAYSVNLVQNSMQMFGIKYRQFPSYLHGSLVLAPGL